MTLANGLSLARAGLAAPILFIGLTTPRADAAYLGAAALFALAVATDVADGELARRRRATTLLGTILDPVADAVLVLSTLLPFAVRMEGFVAAFVLLVARDAVVLDLRLHLARHGIALPAVPASKAKTAFLDVACASLLLAMGTGGSAFVAVAYACLGAGIFLSLTSALRYFARSRDAHA